MRRLRVALAWIVAGIVLSASVTGLWHVATEKAAMAPLAAASVVAAFDVTAIIVGLRVVEQPRRWSAWGMLIAMAALSATAQIMAAPTTLEWWRMLHGAPAVAAIWTLHGAVSEGHEEKPAKTKPKAKTKPAEPTAAPAPAPPAISETTGDAGDARRPALKTVPSAERMLDDIDEWLTAAGRRPSKTSVQEAARARDLPCKGSEAALAVAAQIRDRRERAS